MSTDYEAVGGYGIVLTKELTEKVISRHSLNRDEFSEELESLLEGFVYLELAQFDNGEHFSYCIILSARNLEELCVPGALKELQALFGVEFTAKDLKRISELYWY